MCALDAIQVRRSTVSRSRHQLGGYGRFEADFPVGAPLDSMDFFFQIGSDRKADMEWGAAGDLYFFAQISEKCSEGLLGCLPVGLTIAPTIDLAKQSPLFFPLG